jgi:hypothetical protein
MKKYSWPNFHFGSNRALYVRDDEGVMRRVGTVVSGQRIIYLAGEMYTIKGDVK